MKALDFLYPPRCPFCTNVSRLGGICRDCLDTLASYSAACPRCTKPRGFCSCKEVGGDGGLTAPFVYRGVAQRAILSFKRYGTIDHASALASYIAESVYGITSAEVVTAVPSTAKSFRRRGYNPAELLAVEVAAELSLPYEALLKSKDGKSQKDMKSSEDRILNVQDRFYIADGADVLGRRILLIDDVRTTGATLGACREELLAHGALYVESCVFATD